MTCFCGPSHLCGIYESSIFFLQNPLIIKITYYFQLIIFVYNLHLFECLQTLRMYILSFSDLFQAWAKHSFKPVTSHLKHIQALVIAGQAYKR